MDEQLKLLVFLLFFGGRLLGQGKMLAPRNGGTRLCRQWSANSGARAGADLVHEPPQNLVLSFPLHQVFKPFQCSAGTDLVHKSQQNLVLSFPLHQVSGPFRRSAGTRWKVSGRRLESRKGEWPRPFSFSSFPQSKASGGTPEAHELLFLCSISIQSISIS